MKTGFVSFLTNKYIRILGVLSLISGIVFVTWAVIPINATQKELDEVLNNSKLVVEEKNDYIVVKAKDTVAKVGFIFYPGAKVDSKAYLYKLSSLALQEKFVIYITKPFLHYTITDVNQADKVIEQNPKMLGWVIGGHSLGGAMACTYIKNHEKIKTLIIVGSYCSDDISKTDKKVLSINGSNDGLIDAKKIANYRKNVPSDARYVVIDGMNHAQAGNYGDQFGDNPIEASDSIVKLEINVAISSIFQ